MSDWSTSRPRIGNELKAGQERGELATREAHGRGDQGLVRGPDMTPPSTLPEIGIPRTSGNAPLKFPNRFPKSELRTSGNPHLSIRSRSPQLGVRSSMQSGSCESGFEVVIRNCCELLPAGRLIVRNAEIPNRFYVTPRMTRGVFAWTSAPSFIHLTKHLPRFALGPQPDFASLLLGALVKAGPAALPAFPRPGPLAPLANSMFEWQHCATGRISGGSNQHPQICGFKLAEASELLGLPGYSCHWWEE